MERALEIIGRFATEDNVSRRDFMMGETQCVMLFYPDLIDKFVVREIIREMEKADIAPNNGLKEVCERLLPSAETDIEYDLNEVIENLLSGDLVIIVDKVEGFLIVNARKYDKRAIAEPPIETVMRGPREGFIEDLKTNLSLIERRLRTPALAVEKYRVGRISSTTVALIYLSTVASPVIVQKVREKLKAIDIDALVDSYYLQPLIEDHPYSIFHQTGVSEKPDIVSAKLLEGRVAIVVDGSPMVITVPFLFMEDIQSSEDYYERNAFSTFLRIMRFIALLIGVLLPGVYVAIEIFHQEVIPIRFLSTLMNAIKGIPLPPLAELIFVLLLFEIIREASVRMPRAVGMAMSIVGALVLGETAVNAGIIGSPSVMIIALSSISLYNVPNEVGTMSLLRIMFLLLGGLTGIYGIIIGGILVLHKLASINNFDAPYLAPFAPLVPNDLEDSLMRAPIINLKTRPESFANVNPVRQGTNLFEEEHGDKE